MIILDTNVLSELIKPQGSTIVRNWAARQPVTSLFTTTITKRRNTLWHRHFTRRKA